ncbi:MAG: hypothetical protein ACI8UO_002781 [Verrucomicrobiales bacterium]|jgi:hypothetical protein
MKRSQSIIVLLSGLSIAMAEDLVIAFSGAKQSMEILNVSLDHVDKLMQLQN